MAVSNSLWRKKFSLAALLVHAGYWLGMPIFSAVGWRLGMYRRKMIKSRHNSGKKLIILAKSAGIEDVDAAYETENPEYPVLFLPRHLLKILCRYYLKGRVSDRNYFPSDPSVEAAKIAYRKFLTEVLKSFDRLFNIGAFLQFNIVYHAERELASACRDLGIPFITAYKESLRSRTAWDLSAVVFKKVMMSYCGWKVAVYNSDAREALVKSGIIEPWQVEVTGCARLDYSHQKRFAGFCQPEDGLVLYYLISPVAGLGFLRKKGGTFYREEPGYNEAKHTWGNMIDKVNAAFLAVARNRPDLQFIAKGKRGVSQLQVNSLGHKLPDNVRIIRDGVGHNLLEKASVVLGFNSTTVLEAVAAGVPTIVPNIFSKDEEELLPYVIDVCEAVYCPKTAGELERLIVDLAGKDNRQSRLTSAQKKVLERLLGNPDGKSGYRLKKFIDEAMKTDRKDLLEALRKR